MIPPAGDDSSDEEWSSDGEGDSASEAAPSGADPESSDLDLDGLEEYGAESEAPSSGGEGSAARPPGLPSGVFQAKQGSAYHFYVDREHHHMKARLEEKGLPDPKTGYDGAGVDLPHAVHPNHAKRTSVWHETRPAPEAPGVADVAGAAAEEFGSPLGSDTGTQGADADADGDADGGQVPSAVQGLAGRRRTLAIVFAGGFDAEFKTQPSEALGEDALLTHCLRNVASCRGVTTTAVATYTPAVAKQAWADGIEHVVTLPAEESGQGAKALSKLDLAHRVVQELAAGGMDTAAFQCVLVVPTACPLFDRGIVEAAAQVVRRSRCCVVTRQRRVADIDDLHSAIRVTKDAGGQVTHIVRMTGHKMKPGDAVHLLTGITAFAPELVRMAPVIRETFIARRLGIDEITIMESGYRVAVLSTTGLGELETCANARELARLRSLHSSGSLRTFPSLLRGAAAAPDGAPEGSLHSAGSDAPGGGEGPSPAASSGGGDAAISVAARRDSGAEGGGGAPAGAVGWGDSASQAGAQDPPAAVPGRRSRSLTAPGLEHVTAEILGGVEVARAGGPPAKHDSRVSIPEAIPEGDESDAGAGDDAGTGGGADAAAPADAAPAAGADATAAGADAPADPGPAGSAAGDAAPAPAAGSGAPASAPPGPGSAGGWAPSRPSSLAGSAHEGDSVRAAAGSKKASLMSVMFGGGSSEAATAAAPAKPPRSRRGSSFFMSMASNWLKKARGGGGDPAPAPAGEAGGAGDAGGSAAPPRPPSRAGSWRETARPGSGAEAPGGGPEGPGAPGAGEAAAGGDGDGPHPASRRTSPAPSLAAPASPRGGVGSGEGEPAASTRPGPAPAAPTAPGGRASAPEAPAAAPRPGPPPGLPPAGGWRPAGAGAGAAASWGKGAAAGRASAPEGPGGWQPSAGAGASRGAGAPGWQPSGVAPAGGGGAPGWTPSGPPAGAGASGGRGADAGGDVATRLADWSQRSRSQARGAPAPAAPAAPAARGARGGGARGGGAAATKPLSIAEAGGLMAYLEATRGDSPHGAPKPISRLRTVGK